MGWAEGLIGHRFVTESDADYGVIVGSYVLPTGRVMLCTRTDNGGLRYVNLEALDSDGEAYWTVAPAEQLPAGVKGMAAARLLSIADRMRDILAKCQEITAANPEFQTDDDWVSCDDPAGVYHGGKLWDREMEEEDNCRERAREVSSTIARMAADALGLSPDDDPYQTKEDRR